MADMHRIKEKAGRMRQTHSPKQKIITQDQAEVPVNHDSQPKMLSCSHTAKKNRQASAAHSRGAVQQLPMMMPNQASGMMKAVTRGISIRLANGPSGEKKVCHALGFF